MKKIILLALVISTIPFKSFAASAPITPINSNQIPTAKMSQFTVGNVWIWNYFEQGDHSKFYSSERYTVTAVIGDAITIEIWTKYANTTSYTPSARFTAHLNDCAHAFDGGVYHPFTLELHGYAKGAWSTEAYQVPSTAFEEKFNCNPEIYAANDTRFSTNYAKMATPLGPNSALFQQLSKSSSQITSFYFLDDLKWAGVAYTKRFNPNSPFEYAFELQSLP